MLEPARAFQVFLKPIGSACNLKCRYCYYRHSANLTGNVPPRVMSDEILEKYITDHFDAASGPDYFFSWHGGEPTLAGIEFYRRAVALQKKHMPSGSRVMNGIQTNATLITEEWCRFLSAEGFYVGVSIDGPQEIHDAMRVTQGELPSFKKVTEGYEMLKSHGIKNEILCVVSSINAGKAKEVYSFFKSLGAKYLTFLPLVIRSEMSVDGVTEYSAGSESFGDFLIEIFEEWVTEDIGKVQIQIIEEAIGTVFREEHTLCIFKRRCGDVPVVEMNGDFYSCDHYVQPRHLIGNIRQKTLSKLLDSEGQKAFGNAKQSTLPGYCRQCEVLGMCNGECPKNRFIFTPDGEPGLNYLCSGYKKFFSHIRPFTAAIAAEWKNKGS